MSNTFGNIFKLTTFGESHGVVVGGVIDGCPSGLEINLEFVQKELDRRKPGRNNTSPRKEKDKVRFVSGMKSNKTTGAPLAFFIENKDSKSSDYSSISNIYRPSHADYTYQKKYGIRDELGGGRSSARETVCRVVAGAVAKQYLYKKKIRIHSFVSQIGILKINSVVGYCSSDKLAANKFEFCPDTALEKEMIKLVEKVKKTGDSIGGRITCFAENIPIGLGEPVYSKIEAELAKAMLSINAVKAFEIGKGFESCAMMGSEHNDTMYIDKNKSVKFKSNNSGGVLGGISNGDILYFNVGFKPTATIFKNQETINKDNQLVTFIPEGRHDPCVVLRAQSIVESMLAIVLVDLFLLNLTSRS